MSRSVRSDRLIVALALLVAIPLYAFFGYVFWLDRSVVQEFDEQQWRTPTEILAKDSAGKTVTVARVYGRDWRPSLPLRIEEIPPYVSNAFIAAEDVRFRKHLGIDPVGIVRALFINIRRGEVAQGGSTIDQQLIKAKFLTQERTYRRKIVEMALAVALDMRVGKDEILEAYLNDVYLGHVNGRPVMGVDEGARIFFNRRPSRLTLGQAALIASIIRAPNILRKRPEEVRARRDAILGVMRDQEWISPADHDKALTEPVRFELGDSPRLPYPSYLSALRTELVDSLGKGVLRKGGIKVHCEMNPRMQQAAEKAAVQGAARLTSRFGWIGALSRGDPLQVVVLAMHPETGGVRALVGGTNSSISSIDRTAAMKRQPGSAFKTFAYLTAIESRKATNATLLLDTPLTVEVSSKETWSPHNYDERYRGRVTVREAFEKSLNVPTVRLTAQIGSGRVVRAAEKFGFREDFADVPALPLGVTEVTPRELTSAYTVFPNLGKITKPFLLAEVRDRQGKLLYRKEPKSERVTDAGTAFVVHSLLRGVVRRGTARRLQSYGMGHAAGKTGTTSDYRDAWFVGYTRGLVATVWVGFDRGAPLRLSSSEAAIPIWGSFMRAVPADVTEIAPPSGVDFKQIDPESGYLWSEGCPGPFREVFLTGTAPKIGCPRGMLGRVMRRILFDDQNFDEPAAITFEKYRRLANEVEQNRRRWERRLDRLRRIFGRD